VRHKAIQERLHVIEGNHDSLLNANNSLENWVEKYVPLQVQARIVQTIEKLLPTRKKLKLYTINMSLTEGLRDEILKDTGTARLRKRVLDVITQLRSEAEIILQQKQVLRE
jgi:hypothetical protein